MMYQYVFRLVIQLRAKDYYTFVLWVLIAHELCPHARRFVRELNSEPVPDPTLDA